MPGLGRERTLPTMPIYPDKDFLVQGWVTQRVAPPKL